MKATPSILRARIAELERDIERLSAEVPLPSWVHTSWVDGVSANELKETMDKIVAARRERVSALKASMRELSQAKDQLRDLEEEQ